MLLLRMCVHPRINHILRSSYTDVILELASSFDVVVREGVESLIGVQFTEGSVSHRQLQLPIRHGGLGFVPMKRIVPAAFLGSWMQCLQGVERAVGAPVLGDGAMPSSATLSVARAEAALSRRGAAALDWRAISCRPVDRGQRALMTRQHQVARATCMSIGTPQDRARIQSCSGWGAGAFLAAVPSEAELSLSNTDMQLAVRLRLGLPLAGDGAWCARCRRRVDPLGNHAHACNGNSTIRHNRIRDKICMLMLNAGFDAMTEQEEPSLRHRPDLRVEHGLAPTLTYLDVSVVHSTAPSANHVANAESPVAAVEAAWQDKLDREYAPLPRRMPYRLLPAVCSSYGTWHPQTRNFFRECASRIGAANASLPGSAALPSAILRSWVCKLSICLQRENALMMKRCVTPDGDFGLDRAWSEESPLLWELTCMSCACGDATGDQD